MKRSKILACFLFGLIAIILLWKLNRLPPDPEYIADLASIAFPQKPAMLEFDRLIDGREPAYIATLSLTGDAEKFCSTNNLQQRNFESAPFVPGERGYRQLLGAPGLCFGEKEIKDGHVYIVARPHAVVIYVYYTA